MMKRVLQRLTMRLPSGSPRFLTSASGQGKPGGANIFDLPLEFLRAACSTNFDANGQRTDVSFDSRDGKPILLSSPSSSAQLPVDENTPSWDIRDNHYHLTWRDGHVSTFSFDWVERAIARRTNNEATSTNRIYWSGLDGDLVRSSNELCLDFTAVLMDDDGMRAAIRALYTHGILLIQNTPIYGDNGAAGIAALAAAVSGGSIKDNSTSLVHHYRKGGREVVLKDGTDGPFRTLYGSVWSTTSTGQPQGVSTADSAYGHDSLPLHTDMTYYKEPPGLQIFGMVENSKQGGESVFGDGFYAAERLRNESPESFKTLSSISRRYHSCDMSTGWFLEASGPIITLDEHNNVEQIRHNDLDRLPDLPPPLYKGSTDDFFTDLADAHRCWDGILARDDVRLVIDLEPGETMLVANQRVFHGRKRFRGSRSVTGCYVSQDDLDSRFRMAGLLQTWSN